MLYNRINLIDKISDVLSHIVVKTKLKQKLNDLSLNVHSEDFFLEVFNYVFSANYVNTNIGNSNEAYIDLVDHKLKKFIQVTTNTDAGKIKNSFKILNEDKYKDYSVYIYYLIDKPATSKKVVELIKEKYGIENLKEYQLDMGDLLKSITALPESKIKILYERYFRDVDETYTDEIVLQNVIELLIKDFKQKRIPHDADFVTTELDDKMQLNRLTVRVKREIIQGLDYSDLISELEPAILNDLTELTIQQCYRPLLINTLRGFNCSLSILNNMSVLELHDYSKSYNVDYSYLINNLKQSLNSRIHNDSADLNSDAAILSIISFYFELCEVGVKS
ncbi:SMEK domain-containing protein [Shewanella sp. DNRA4]|uniref:SMEK domain-containing protein n=1 Tax=Shewanella sp. DNRA4 TaxID=2723055 RepID=UPI00146C28AA|nr:SMEK domain-containing protein [Shewanella sp. DNRA4]NMD52694.1 SMEK domain-containing protein [Shewanella sp. DNRA4]